MTCGRSAIAVVVLLSTFAQGCAHIGNRNRNETEEPWDASSAVLSVWYVGDFNFLGTIRNANDGVAVPYAELTFVGTKLPTDYDGHTGKVGMADRNGVVDQVYSHNWCATMSAADLDMDPALLAGMDRDEAFDALYAIYAAAKRLSIEIHKAGFETYKAEYSLVELTSESGFSVPLGDIKLQPLEKAPKP